MDVLRIQFSEDTEKHKERAVSVFVLWSNHLSSLALVHQLLLAVIDESRYETGMSHNAVFISGLEMRYIHWMIKVIIKLLTGSILQQLNK